MTLLTFPKMVNFRKLFREEGTKDHPYPRKIKYKDKTIFLSDKFPIRNKDTLIFSIENTNSKYPQGFCIGVYDGYLKVNGDPMPRRKHANILFWENSEVLDMKNLEIQVFTKQDHIFIKNLWEIDIYEETRCINGKETIVKFEEGKRVACFVGGDQWAMGKCNGAAMYSEDLPDGKRYFCNDGNEDDDFDDIIFTVRRI